MTLFLVLLGGAVGAPTRSLTDVAVQRLHRTTFPWGTWTVNVAGSLVLGVVAAGQRVPDGELEASGAGGGVVEDVGPARAGGSGRRAAREGW